MKEKVALVTGATSGIGKATAHGLAQTGCTVIMVCRDEKRGERALSDIIKKTGNSQVHLYKSDFSSQQSIRQLAKNIRKKFKKLHVLINNAAIVPKTNIITEDKLELQWAVNHMAYFLLTHLLLDLLKADTPSRIINVSSEAHQGIRLDLDTFFGMNTYKQWMIYKQTKLANVLFTYSLARILKEYSITVNCLHPGLVDTNIFRNTPSVVPIISKLFFKNPSKGAQTTLYLACSEDVNTISSNYFINKKAVSSSAESYDESQAELLWAKSAELTGI